MSGFVPVLAPTSRTLTGWTHVNWLDPLDLTSWSWPLSYSLHALSYVLFLYQHIPLLAIFIHLLFMSQSPVFDLDLSYIPPSFRLLFSLDI